MKASSASSTTPNGTSPDAQTEGAPAAAESGSTKTKRGAKADKSAKADTAANAADEAETQGERPVVDNVAEGEAEKAGESESGEPEKKRATG